MNTEFGGRNPRGWRNALALGAVVGIAFLMVGLNACSSGSQSAENSNQPAAVASDAAS
jgi:hypothetical protein